MTVYIIKSSLSLLLLFGLYWFLLRKEKLFVFNRFFLIASVVFSLVVPFVSIPVNLQSTPQLESFIPANNHITPEIISSSNVVTNVATNVVNENQSYVLNETSQISISVFLLVIYISGLILFLIRFLRNLYFIIRKISLSEKIRIKNYQIILTNDQTGPCCFFDYIFLNREDYRNGKIDKDLLNHEMEHAKQSHTIDIILIELVKVFYWFNPVYLLYERAIRINHEYLADNGAISDNSDIKCYADKLLNFITCSSNLSLTSGSNNSFTKMRLIMIMKSHSGSFKYGARIGITLIMFTIIFMLLSFKESKHQSLATDPLQSGTEIQQNIVKGIVLTEDGKPLIDATITTVGPDSTSLRYLLFPDGRFTLNDIQPGAQLTIERQGFKKQTLKADLSSAMTVRMVRDPDYKGKIILTERQTVNFRNSDFTPANSLVVVNGEILDKNGVLKVNPSDIKSLIVLADKEAESKYGDEGKDGVLEIILFGNKTAGTKQVLSKSTDSDSSIFNTFLSINHTSNKGELIDIPIANLQYASVWTYHNIEESSKKEFRSISIKTRDYYKVRGKIVGENEKPLSGAKVRASGNPLIVASDRKGSFEISDVQEGSLLEFSFPGYQTYYLSTLYEVAFKENLTVDLKKDGIPDYNLPITSSLPISNLSDSKASNPKTLILVDGVVYTGELNDIPINEVDNLSVRNKYGTKGMEKVIEVTTKKRNSQVKNEETMRIDPTKTNPNPVLENKPYIHVEQMPEFQGGGLDLMRTWLTKNTNYPTEAFNQKTEGIVSVRFIVNSTGEVQDITIINPNNPLLDNEVKRVISTMPDWKPGKQDGKPVDVYITTWVTFALQ